VLGTDSAFGHPLSGNSFNFNDARGLLFLIPTGELLYTANPAFLGTFAFDYTVFFSDAVGPPPQDVGTVTITVAAPTATPTTTPTNSPTNTPTNTPTEEIATETPTATDTATATATDTAIATVTSTSTIPVGGVTEMPVTETATSTATEVTETATNTATPESPIATATTPIELPNTGASPGLGGGSGLLAAVLLSVALAGTGLYLRRRTLQNGR
jgi:hypothetical protein